MAASSEQDAGKGKTEPLSPQNRIALGLIVMFVAVLVTLGFLRGDAHWDRLIYLLSGFEAIVFAAVGTLFGVSVSRTSVATAREDAETAKAETQQHKSEAHRAVLAAADGRTLAATILAKVRTNQLVGGDVAELAQLALRLFPDLAEPEDRDAWQNAVGFANEQAFEDRRARAAFEAQQARGRPAGGSDVERG